MRRVVESLLERQANGRPPVPVLIRGETGTGKGLLSRVLVGASSRAAAPFVPVNCAAIPETLLEAELFGYERGAFTDARNAKPGLFQSAHRGTVFLDEIGFLPLSLQAKLLAAVEDRAVRRIGGTRAEPIDVWLLSATNADLGEAIREERFLEALYHRLAVVRIELPPLRERGDDALLLAEHFLRTLCEEHRVEQKTLSADACMAIESHPWPGNVRELHNTIQRAVLLSDSRVVTASTLGLQRAPKRRSSVSVDAQSPERAALLATLEQVGWNLSRAAAALAIPRNTLRYRMEKLRLRRTSEVPAAVEPVESALLEIALDPDWVRGAPSAASRFFERVAVRAATDGARVLSRGSARLVAGFASEPFEEAPERAARCALAIWRDCERERSLGHGTAPRIVLDRAVSALPTDVPYGAIAVGPALVPALARRFDLQRDGGVWRLRGCAELGAGASSTLVGRDAERALLASRLDGARDGRGSVVALSGELGIGKSRLVWELGQAAPDALLVAARATPHGSTRPYALLADLVRAALAGSELDRVAAAEDAHALARLLGDGAEALASSAALRTTTEEAFGRFVTGLSRERPVVLAAEDLHWADEPSQDALAALAQRVAASRVLLLATFRPPHRPSWLDVSPSTQLSLLPLSRADAERLAVARSEDAAVSSTAVALSGGNPLFVEQLAPRDADAYAVAQHAVETRLARLPSDTRRVLQIASVLGVGFAGRALRMLSDDAPVEPHLRTLLTHDLVQPNPALGEGHWAFRHALVQRIALATLAEEERVALHLAAARALELTYADRLDDHAAAIASQYERAGDATAALAWIERANRVALRRSEVKTAHDTFEKARSLLGALPDTRPNRRRRVALLLDQPVMFMGLMKLTEYRDLVRQHEAMAEALQEPGLLGQLYSRLGWSEWALGDVRVAIDALGTAIELCVRADLPHDAGIAQLAGGWAHILAGDLTRALDLETQALERLSVERDPHAHAAAHAGRGWALAEMGRYREAEQAGRRALRLAEDLGDGGLVSFAAWGLSRTYGLDGEIEQALEMGRLSEARAATPLDGVLAGCHVGWALCRTGEARRGVELLGDLLSSGRRSGFAVIDEFTPYLGEGLLELGELERAHQLFAKCLDDATARGQRLASGRARRWLGEVAWRRGDREQARHDLERAVDMLRPLGALSELARAEGLLAAL